jgi:hypothetical protein
MTDLSPTGRPLTWAQRANWGLPFVCGAHAVVLLASFRAGSIALAGLSLIACYGLIERRKWGFWLAGVLAVVAGLWEALFLLASLVGSSGPVGLASGLLQGGLGLVLSVGVLVLLLLADGPAKGPGGRWRR